MIYWLCAMVTSLQEQVDILTTRDVQRQSQITDITNQLYGMVFLTFFVLQNCCPAKFMISGMACCFLVRTRGLEADFSIFIARVTLHRISSENLTPSHR